MAGDKTGNSENIKKTDKGTDTNKTARIGHAGWPQYYNYQGYGYITRHYIKARVAATRVTEPSGEGQAGDADNKIRLEN